LACDHSNSIHENVRNDGDSEEEVTEGYHKACANEPEVVLGESWRDDVSKLGIIKVGYLRVTKLFKVGELHYLAPLEIFNRYGLILIIFPCEGGGGGGDVERDYGKNARQRELCSA
jgi:hypothetical protein